jgi:hypothetical protein
MQTTKQNPARRGRLGTTAARSQHVLTALRRIIRATDLHSKQLAREVGLTTPTGWKNVP